MVVEVEGGGGRKGWIALPSHNITYLNYRYHHGQVYKEPEVSLVLVEGCVRGG